MKPCEFCLLKAAMRRAEGEGKALTILKRVDGTGIYIHPNYVKILQHQNNDAILEEHLSFVIKSDILPKQCTCTS